MTSMRGDVPHPEVSEISDLSEGLLAPERAAEVRAHLAGCAVCADVLTSLEEIRSLLGTLPEVRMPDDVADRIDTALAAQALYDASLPDVPRETTGDVPRGTSPGDTPPADEEEGGGEGTSGRVTRTPVTDAEPSVAPEDSRGTSRGTGDVPRGTSTAPGGRPAGPTAPGSSTPRLGAPSGSRPGGRRMSGRRARVTAAYAAGVLALGGLVYAVASAGSGGSSSQDSTRASSAAAPDDVETKVRDLLAAPALKTGGLASADSGDSANSPMTGATPHTDVATGPTALPSCVLQATHRPQQPIAAEHDDYRGVAAYLLVLPNPGNVSMVDAFVVSASCTPSSPGTVLFHASYPR